MPKYKKCPRCELNYILESETYCSVCKDEMSGMSSDDLYYDDSFTRICPRCGINSIADDQEYCDACRADMEALSVESETEEEWQKGAKDAEVAFPELDDEAEDEELDPALVLEDPDILAELESEEESDAELDQEEEAFEEEDDFDYDDVDPDDYEDDEDDEEGDSDDEE